MKTVLVTGASGDIGSEIARAFAKCGYNVVVNYNTSEKQAKELCREIEAFGVESLCIKADVSVKAEVDNMFDMIKSHFGGVDVLVNNAAFSSVKMLIDVDQEEWDKTLGINLKGAYFCINASSPYMVKNGFGRIINVSSVWGQKGASCEAHYSASKAGLDGLTKSMAKELSLSGITVNAVSPGFIDTKMNSHLSKEDVKSICSEIPVGRTGSTKDVANAVLFLAHENSSYITGQVLCVDGGWSL